MAGNRRAAVAGGAWFLSFAVHGGLAAVAALVIVGPFASADRSKPIADASYTVTLRPGGELLTLAEPPREDARVYGTAKPDPVTFDGTIANIPEFKLTSPPLENTGSTAPAAGEPGRPLPGQGHERIGRISVESAGEGGGGGGGAVAKGASGAGQGTGSGGGSGEASGIPATVLESPAPVYPDAARRRNLEGAAVVEISIRADGAVEKGRVIASSGSPALDDAALAAIRAWRYRPASVAGKAVPSVQRVKFVFRLE